MNANRSIDAAVDRAFGSVTFHESSDEESSHEPPAAGACKGGQKNAVIATLPQGVTGAEPERRSRAKEPATSAGDACSICQSKIEATSSHVRLASCGHKFHLFCLEPLLAKGQRRCTSCPDRDETAVDTGNDVYLREMLQILRARRQDKVRSLSFAAQTKAGALRSALQDYHARGNEQNRRANRVFAVTLREAFAEEDNAARADDPFARAAPKAEPREGGAIFRPFVSALGGVAQRFAGGNSASARAEGEKSGPGERASGKCKWPRLDLPDRVADCPIGAEHCLHAFAVAPSAARLHVLYDAKCPLPEVERASARVRRLLQKKLAPRDLVACGVDVPLLAVCGVTCRMLVKTFGYLPEDVTRDMACTWQDLRLLAWEPSLLRKRWPAVACHGVFSAGDVLSHHAVTFAELTRQGRLTLLEVACLGFTGAFFLSAKATGDEVCACALRDPETVPLALRCMPTLTEKVFNSLPCNVQRLHETPALVEMLQKILALLEGT